MIQVVFPSAGHHLKDSGAVHNGRKENEENISFREALLKELGELGVKSIVDKDTETNTQYRNRIKPGSGSVVLDIHFNASPNKSATGTECFVASNANQVSKDMAMEICKATSDVLGIKNRGVKTDSQSQHSKLPILYTGAGISVLYEVCFITNDDDMITYDNNKDRLIKEIASILKKYEDKF